MSLQSTPRASRVHIGIFGRRNSGKSSMINAITNQNVAIVSDLAGTTTDPVYKSIEIHGIGPCVIIDTAGFDDSGEVGDLRISQTEKILEKTDLAILLLNPFETKQVNLAREEIHWLDSLKTKKIPVVAVINKVDLQNDSKEINEIKKEINEIKKEMIEKYKIPVVFTSTVTGEGIGEVREQLIRALPEDFEHGSITGNLVKEGDRVLLVMPQDIQAPKGRLILPQVQVLRELLDKKCITMCVTDDKLEDGLASLEKAPELIITDSRVFRAVYDKKPEESMLTSFSVLMAGYKGDLKYFAESAFGIERLTEQSKVLIAEACTHAPLEEDIGREKIPAMLRKRVGNGLQVDVVAGSDFPEDVARYDLIIHCGACMFNRKHVLSRIEKARAANVPMSNYGVTIAYLSGILDKIDLA